MTRDDCHSVQGNLRLICWEGKWNNSAVIDDKIFRIKSKELLIFLSVTHLKFVWSLH